MSADATPIHRDRLFLASRVALIVTAMSFALRGGAAGAWASDFGLSNEQVGWINGTAFWGFTLAMMFGGPLCDTVGLGRILKFASIGHLAGIVLTVFAHNFATLYAGTLIFGIANGAVEAACNPMIATMFPEEKTTKLNHFHVWFPGGIVIGGLLAYGMGMAGLGWRGQFAVMLLPLVVYTWMFVGQAFPKTERVQSGASTASMFKAVLRPGFLLMVACMLMTSSTELGPGQWIPNILTNAGVPGILVLAWINGLMAIGRQSAGPFVHRLSPPGMLITSAILACLGLLAISHSSGLLLFLSASLFALGVCFFWPTMLGYVSERYPETGALGLAIMGGAGMLSVSFILPVIGKSVDAGIASRIPAGTTPAALAAAPDGSPSAHLWMQIQAEAGLGALQKVAILPAILTVVFILLFVAGRSMRRKPAKPIASAV